MGCACVPHTGELLLFSPHCPLPISCTTQLFHPEGRGAANELHFWPPSSRRCRLKPPDLVKWWDFEVISWATSGPECSCYQIKLGSPCTAKLMPGQGARKYSIYNQAPSEQNGELTVKNTEGRVSQDSVRERVLGYVISSCTDLWQSDGGLEGKASACNAGDLGSIPGSGRSPGEGNGNPLQYSCLENPMDREAW